MSNAAQFSGLAAFTEGLQGGLETGYKFADKRRESKERDAKAETAEILGQLSSYDPSSMEEAPAEEFTGALPNPLRRRGYTGNNYKALEDKVRAAVAKSGDPDAVLALNQKLLDLRRHNTLSAFDEAIAASQFGNTEGLLAAGTKLSAYLFPGVQTDMEVAATRDLAVFRSKNPDGSDAGNIALDLSPENLSKLRMQFENPAVLMKMMQDQQQYERTQQFREESYSADLALKEREMGLLDQYRQGTLAVQNAQVDISRNNAETQQLVAMGQLSADAANARRDEVLLQKTQQEMDVAAQAQQHAPRIFAANLADEARGVLFAEDGGLTPYSEAMGLSAPRAQQVLAKTGSLAMLNYDPQLVFGSMDEYVDVANKLVQLGDKVIDLVPSGGFSPDNPTIMMIHAPGVIPNAAGTLVIPASKTLIEAYIARERGGGGQQPAQPAGAIPE